MDSSTNTDDDANIHEEEENCIVREAENDTPTKRTNTGKRKENPAARGSEASSKPNKQIVTRSKVWEHYTRLENDNDRCKCHYCGRDYSCLTANGTTNLKKHLESCKQFNAWMQNKQASLQREGTVGTVKFGKVSEDVFHEATNEMLVLGELPLSFVECLAWKHLCDKVKLYTAHSRRQSTRDIVKMYARKKEQMKKMIGNQRVSLTTDIWVDPTTGHSYMVIIAHFIDRNWRLRKVIIGFKNVGDHEGQTVAFILLECLDEWCIKKVFTITVDNATTNTSALTIFKEEFSEVGALVLDGKYMHMRCAAHIINLVVRDGLQEVNASVTAIRNGVLYVRSASSQLQSFELRVDSGEMSRGSLSLDCKTRWNSAYLMLTRAKKFRVAFDKMQAEDKLYDQHFEEKVEGNKRVGPPCKTDWEAVEGLVRFLNFFYNATLVVSASNRVNASNCYTEICTIERNLLNIIEEPDQELQKKALAMRAKFDKYWEGLKKINRLLIVASVFDHRNKIHFAMMCIEMVYGEGSAESKELNKSVLDVLQDLFKEYSSVFGKSDTNGGTGGAQSQSTGTSSQNDLEGDRLDVDDDNDGYQRMDFVYMAMVNEKEIQDASDELELYLKGKIENPVVMKGTEWDVLSWWQCNVSKYPIQSEIARDVLAMQVNSVASESAFSTSGRILDPYRSCLTHYMIEVLMCLEQWLKCTIHLTERGAVITTKELLSEIELQDELEKKFQNN